MSDLAGYVGVMTLILVGPGAVYGLCAFHVKRRRMWAISLGLGLAFFHIVLGVPILLLIASAMDLRDPAGETPLRVIVAVGCDATIYAAWNLQVLYVLCKSYYTVLEIPPERGFEPVITETPQVPVPGKPVRPDDGGSDGPDTGV